MDNIKASQLGNWELLFPTHPPLFFLHFLGLACFSISLTTHSFFFQLVRSLIYLGSALATYGGLLYELSAFLSFMSCLHTTHKVSLFELYELSPYNSIFIWGMYYLCTLLFIIIQWKDTHQYSSLHSCDSFSFLLSIFHVYACGNS